MFSPILLAFLLSATLTNEAYASQTPSEPLKVSLGNMSFSGDAINLTKSGNGAFECEIDGRAEFTLRSDGDTSFAIAAQKLVISRNANSEIDIRCTGDCKFKDSEHKCRADSMQIRLAKKFEMQLLGNSHVEYGTGDNRIALAGGAITFQGDTVNLTWATSIKSCQ